MSAPVAASALPVAAQPLLDPSREPAWVRHGSARARSAYETAVGFEQVLVDQLTQAMASSVSATSDSSGSGGAGASDSGATDSGSGSSGGLLGSDPASSMYGQMLPGTLTGAIMGGGGTGLAAQLAASLDPSDAARR